MNIHSRARARVGLVFFLLSALASVACQQSTSGSDDAETGRDAAGELDAGRALDAGSEARLDAGARDGGETRDAGTVIIDAALTCTAPLRRCGDRCIDVTRDPAHCGACDAVCGEGEACESGECVLSCGDGARPCVDRCVSLVSREQACDGTCVDTGTSSAHCGACGRSCGAGESCEGGRCVLPCEGPLVDCGGACVDTSRDDSNCGECGASCIVGYACVDSRCARSCGAPLLACGDTCVSAQSDPMNCGECGRMCGGETPFCRGGTCVDACSRTEGRRVCDGTCVDLRTNRAHCGACGNTCGDTQICLSGRCRDVG